MGATTVKRVQTMASHLNGADELVELAIEDAADQLAIWGVSESDSQYERLQRYLAAHYATIDHRRPVSTRTAHLQVSYAHMGMDAGGASKSDLASTEYGQEAFRIMKERRGPVLRVIP